MGLDTADKTCKNIQWYTPDSILDLARCYFGGPVPVDPANGISNPTKAIVSIDGQNGNGLELSWKELGQIANKEGSKSSTVWVNPPYGKEIREWCHKIYIESLQGVEILALLPCGARFSTKYWQSYILSQKLNAVCFIKGRVSFIDGGTGQKAKGNIYDSAIYGYNIDRNKFINTIGQLGKTFIGDIR